MLHNILMGTVAPTTQKYSTPSKPSATEHLLESVNATHYSEDSELSRLLTLGDVAWQASDEEAATMKKRMEEEMKMDKSVYEYDEVWDNIQEARQRQKESKEVDAKERKV